jgi:Flp pilus assembly CpaE family ATPase
VDAIGFEGGDGGSVDLALERPPVGEALPKARILLGIADVAFHQEVLDFVGRDARLELVGSTFVADSLTGPSADHRADAVVLCPTIAARIPAADVDGLPAVLLVAQEMTVPALRVAIDVGAQGAFCWPEERGDLLEVAARARRVDRTRQRTRGRVVAVLGARGGAGVTFVASHLVAVLARQKRSVVLVDMDPVLSDLTAALGVGSEEPVPSVTDLLPVMDELAPDHVSQALFQHPEGFSVLLRRGSASQRDEPLEPASALPLGLYMAAVALLAGDQDAVVIHVGRSSDAFARAAADMADVVLLVTGLDLLSLYGARRLLGSLGLRGHSGLSVVANCTRRSDLSVADAVRILDVPVVARIGFDPAVGLGQDRARLASRRARRLWKDIRTLASRAVPPEKEPEDGGDGGQVRTPVRSSGKARRSSRGTTPTTSHLQRVPIGPSALARDEMAED